jgi:hypothetical protein
MRNAFIPQFDVPGLYGLGTSTFVVYAYAAGVYAVSPALAYLG